jgi:AsmA protein
MRRLFAFLLFLVVAAGIVAALIPYFLSMDVVRNKVAEQLTMWTGRDVLLTGSATLKVFPNILIDISGISIANEPRFGDSPIIAMDGIRGRVKLLPLLSGQIEVDSFELIRPRIELIVDAEGRANWQLSEDSAGDPGESTDAVGGAPPVKLGLLTIQDGTLSYRNLQDGQVFDVTSLNVGINWPDPSSPLDATGSLVWQGEMIKFEGQLGDPISFINNGSSTTTLAIASNPMRATISGLASMTTDLAVNGNLNLDVPSVRGLARWFGTDVPSGPGFGQLTIRSGITAGGDKIALSEAQIEFDGNAAEGAVTFVASEDRPYIQATLALTNLDLNPYLGTASDGSSGGTSGPDWSVDRFDLSGLAELDVDIGLSAGDIDFGVYDIGAGAVTIGLKNSRIAVELAEVGAYGGQLNGNIVVNARGARPSMTAKINASEIDLGAVLDDVAENGRVTGVTNLAIDLASAGNNEKEVVANLSGNGSLQITNGRIIGIDLAGALSGLQRRDFASLVVGTGGETQFDFLEATFTVENGIATVQNLTTQGPAFAANGAGTVDLPAQTLDLKVRASLLNQTGSTEDQLGTPLFEIPLNVTGSWASPRVRPDAAGFIQGNERVQETVRSVGEAVRSGDLDAARDAIDEAIDGGKGDVRSLLDGLLNRDQSQ